MRKAWSSLVLVLFLTTGCGSVLRFTEQSATVYPATRGDLGALRECLNPTPIPNDAWYIGPPWWCIAPFVIPFLIMDVPLAVTVDTLMLPNDIYHSRQAEKAAEQRAEAHRFWEEAFATDIITEAEAARYFSADTVNQIFLTVRDGDVKPNVINAVFGLAMAQTNALLLDALGAHSRISPDQCRRLYHWGQSGGSSHIQYSLARNPATPLDMLTAFASSSDELLVSAVAKSGTLPASDIEKALATAKPEWHQSKLRLASNPATAPDLLAGLAHNDWDGGGIAAGVAANPSTPPEALQHLAASSLGKVRSLVAANQRTSRETVLLLSKDPDEHVRAAAGANPKCQGCNIEYIRPCERNRQPVPRPDQPPADNSTTTP